MGVLVHFDFMHIVVNDSLATLEERPLKAPLRRSDAAGSLDVASGAKRRMAPEGAGHLLAVPGAADPRSWDAAMGARA